MRCAAQKAVSHPPRSRGAYLPHPFALSLSSQTPFPLRLSRGRIQTSLRQAQAKRMKKSQTERQEKAHATCTREGPGKSIIRSNRPQVLVQSSLIAIKLIAIYIDIESTEL